MIMPAISLALALFTGMPQQPSDAPAHVSSKFQFEVQASPARLAPLFGPEGERSWAGEHWNPVFLYPQPATDVQGAVFTVQHGPHTSVWVNTVFDLPAGHMQYVSIIDGVVATTVDVRLSAARGGRTAVQVTYERTALDSAHNDDVKAMGEHDRNSGPEWQAAIERVLSAESQ